MPMRPDDALPAHAAVAVPGVACLLLDDWPLRAFLRRDGVLPDAPLTDPAADRAVATALRTAAARALVCERDVVVAAAPTLREVTPGMPRERALALAPEARVYTRDRRLEAATWEDLLRRLHEFTPRLASEAPGRADLAALSAPALRRLAAACQARVGTGPTRARAHLAARRAAPGAATVVTPGREAAFLARCPVDVLAEAGFDADLPERLTLFGFRTVGALRRLSRRHLTAQFGSDGERLHALLHPPAEPPVPLFVPPPALEARADFLPACDTLDPLFAALPGLVADAAAQLAGRVAQRVRVTVERDGEAPHGIVRLLHEPTDQPGLLERSARDLLRRLLAPEVVPAAEGTPRPVGVLTVALSALATPTPRQASLFVHRPSLAPVVRMVQRRHPGALVRAVPHADAPFTEDAVSFVPWGE